MGITEISKNVLLQKRCILTDVKRIALVSVLTIASGGYCGQGRKQEDQLGLWVRQ